MRSLYLKIFIWFWAAQMLLGLVVGLIARATRPQNDDPPPILGGMMAMRARGAAAVYEHDGAAALLQFLDDPRDKRRGDEQHYFFNVKGAELSGRQTPEAATQLAVRVARSGRSISSSDDKSAFYALRTDTPNGKRYVLVEERGLNGRTGSGGPAGAHPGGQGPPPFGEGGPPPGEGGPFPGEGGPPPGEGRPPFRDGGPPHGRGGPPGPPGGPMGVITEALGLTQGPPGPPPRRSATVLLVRLLAMALTTGLVCYGLARYLTAPAVELRSATRKLAAGDLGVRIGNQMGRRRDELADLGRDFDAMAERLETLMISERRLLGDISHELRSPLARMNVALDLADQSADPETAAFLDRIRLEAERLNQMIGQLLSLARLESGDAPRRNEPVDLGELLHDVVTDAEFEAQSRGRRVVIVGVEDCATTGNADLLRSAFENVVRNALRYTPGDTAVELSLRRRIENGTAEAVFTVRDHGPGVPEEALENLFRPFYRVAAARDRESGGTGLGLAITERAVRVHGGTVTASNAPDGGLQIQIILPATATPPTAA